MKRYAKVNASNQIIEGTYDSPRFLNVTNVYVGAKGTLIVEEGAKTFPAVRDLAVDGTYRIDSLYADDLYAADTKLRLGADAHCYIRTGVTNTVNRLYVNGKYMRAGVYTKDNLSQMNYAKNPTYYGGALVATKGSKGLIAGAW